MTLRRVRLSQVELTTFDAGMGPPVLLVHGFPLDHGMWAEQLEFLAVRSRVIAPDLRGFGTSGETPGTVTMERLADDLAELLDALRVTEPVVLAGLSMGGYVAWQFWRRHAARLRALILCDTRAAADTEEVARARGGLAARVLREGSSVLVEAMLPKLLGPGTSTTCPELVASARRMIEGTSPEGAAAALRGMALRPDVRSWLPEIEVPSLVIVGEHDAISPPEEMLAMAAALPSAQAVTIPRAGHLAPWENPGPVNQAMAEFLTRIGA